LLSKLKENNKNLEIKIRDISYVIIDKNKEKNLNDRLILFGLGDTIKLMKENKCKEYFFDTTFKILT